MRTLIVDDEPVARRVLREGLGSFSDVEIIGEAENGRQALQLVKKLLPDVVVMDIAMPVLNGVEATRQITRYVPNVKVLVLSTYSNDEYVEQLTEAQLVAGRLLTQILRSRYQIDDANCVVHGLVSVNPDNMRICYHHDWVRNFPFAAMGLSDKYQVAPVAISEFGFTYDEDIIAQVGGAMWPGAVAALAEFNRRVTNANLKADDLRKQMRERYRQQMELARKFRETTPDQTESSRALEQTNTPQG